MLLGARSSRDALPKTPAPAPTAAPEAPPKELRATAAQAG
jgi:hypothetical protein